MVVRMNDGETEKHDNDVISISTGESKPRTADSKLQTRSLKENKYQHFQQTSSSKFQ